MSKTELSGLSAPESEPASHPVSEESTSNLTTTTRPIWRVVLGLALPVLAQQFLILSVGLSDRFLAGRLQPDDGSEHATHHMAYQAAQTTAIYMGWLIGGYSTLVSVGATALVARFTGAGNRDSAIRVTNQSFLLAVVLGLSATLGSIWFLRGFVELLQLEGEAAGFAAAYLQPLIGLLVFQLVESAGIACLVGAGDTRTGFSVLGGVALLNLPLAWGLFLGVGPLPRLGFVGIALGTALSHVFGCLVVTLILIRGRAGVRLRLVYLRPNWELLYRLLRISVPAGLDTVTIMLGHFWFLSLVNQLGDAASSAHGIALGWEAMSFLCGVAFGVAAMALVGQNLGAGSPERAARCGWMAFGLGSSVMACMGVIFFLFAPQMFRFFCPYPEQQPIVDTGVPVLRLEAFAEPALASVMIFLHALRGAGDTRMPVLINFLGLFGVRIPLAYIFTRASLSLGFIGVWPGCDWGLFGAWMAMFIDLYVRGCFFLLRFASGRWKTIRV